MKEKNGNDKDANVYNLTISPVNERDWIHLSIQDKLNILEIVIKTIKNTQPYLQEFQCMQNHP